MPTPGANSNTDNLSGLGTGNPFYVAFPDVGLGHVDAVA